MQWPIILIALATAVWFAMLLAKSPRGRSGLLIFSVLDLVGVAAYETYMHVVWEKRVHAPIRIDIFVIDLPLLILGIASGIAGIYRTKTPGDQTGNPQAPRLHMKRTTGTEKNIQRPTVTKAMCPGV